jgi:hypothetical protein
MKKPGEGRQDGAAPASAGWFAPFALQCAFRVDQKRATTHAEVQRAEIRTARQRSIRGRRVDAIDIRLRRIAYRQRGCARNGNRIVRDGLPRREALDGWTSDMLE